MTSPSVDFGRSIVLVGEVMKKRVCFDKARRLQ